MRLTFLSFIFFLLSFCMNAQSETGKKAKLGFNFPIVAKPELKPIEPKPTKSSPFSNLDSLQNTKPLFTPNSSLFNENKKPSFVIGEKPEINLNSQPNFINPNADIIEKLNGYPKPASENFKAIRGNQDLGNFKLDSKFVNIRYRDFGEIDGDLIRVYLNGHVIYENVFLDGYFKGLEITLEKGFNKIDFEALNQGTSGPNTAEFQVFDDNEKLVSANQWNLVTGFKASIMITKD